MFLLFFKEAKGFEIFCETSCHVRRDFIETHYVEIIFKIVDFYDTTDWILFSTSDKIIIAFSVPFAYGENSVNDILREPFAQKILGSYICVLDSVMKHSNNLFIIRRATHSDAHRMLKVSAPNLVALTLMFAYTD